MAQRIILELAEPDCHGFRTIDWLTPESTVQRELTLFWFTIPLWKCKAKRIRPGDFYNDAQVITVEQLNIRECRRE